MTAFMKTYYLVNVLSFAVYIKVSIVIKIMDILEIGSSVVDWIGLAQDRYRWRALVNSVLNLRVP
jgi:hypothetical protein